LVNEKLPRAGELPGNARVQALSDGVFAFAMTLLVLGLEIPKPPGIAPSQLPHYVIGQWPSFLAWIISFLVIGSFWMAHHRLFSSLGSHDDGFVWLNLLVLLSVAFMPFPTSLIGQYSDSQFAVVFYACSLLLAACLMMLLQIYIARHQNLLHDPTSAAALRMGFIRSLAVEVVCLISIGVSFLSPSAALWCWTLILPAQRLATSRLGK
jgi:uncharacterized membrane protein